MREINLVSLIEKPPQNWKEPENTTKSSGAFLEIKCPHCKEIVIIFNNQPQKKSCCGKNYDFFTGNGIGLMSKRNERKSQ